MHHLTLPGMHIMYGMKYTAEAAITECLSSPTSIAKPPISVVLIVKLRPIGTVKDSASRCGAPFVSINHHSCFFSV